MLAYIDFNKSRKKLRIDKTSNFCKKEFEKQNVPKVSDLGTEVSLDSNTFSTYASASQTFPLQPDSRPPFITFHA